VLLVDANFRSPGLTDLLLEAEPRAGLVEALTGSADVATSITETSVPGLRLVAAGAVDSESPRLLQTPRLASLMAQLAGREMDRYDFLRGTSAFKKSLTTEQCGMVCLACRRPTMRAAFGEVRHLLLRAGRKVVQLVSRGRLP